MELKRYGKRNQQIKKEAFNRTNMELKQLIKGVWGMLNNLLIAPIWNWNFWANWKGTGNAQTFNRTNMELKPVNSNQGNRNR